MSRRLTARFAATAATLAAAVIAIRFAYENPDTTHIIAAGTGACAFVAAFSLLLSAALSFGWETGREAAAARYEARLNAEHPLGPIRELGYRVADEDPHRIWEAAHPIEAATEADGAPDEWAQLLAAVTTDEADGADLYAHGRAA